MAVKTFADNTGLGASDINTFLANSGLVYVTGVSISSSAGYTISNCFSATYDNYRVVISGVIGSVAGTLQMRIGAANTGYYGSLYYDLYTGAGTGTNRYNNATLVPATFYSNLNDEGMSTFDVMHPFDTKRTTWSGNYYGGGYAGWFGLTLANTTSYTDFYLFPSSGTFSANVRVYGYREA